MCLQEGVGALDLQDLDLPAPNVGGAVEVEGQLDRVGVLASNVNKASLEPSSRPKIDGAEVIQFLVPPFSLQWSLNR